MRIEQNKIAFAYFRLSREEAQKSEQAALAQKSLLEGKVKELEKELDEMLK